PGPLDARLPEDGGRGSGPGQGHDVQVLRRLLQGPGLLVHQDHLVARLRQPPGHLKAELARADHHRLHEGPSRLAAFASGWSPRPAPPPMATSIPLEDGGGKGVPAPGPSLTWTSPCGTIPVSVRFHRVRRRRGAVPPSPRFREPPGLGRRSGAGGNSPQSLKTETAPTAPA